MKTNDAAVRSMRWACCCFLCLALLGCSMGNGMLRGLWHLDAGRTGKVSSFVSSIRAPRGNPDAHYLLACYYQERGMHEDAANEFNKAVMIDPGHVKAYNGLGISYSGLKEHRMAEEAFMAALKIDPKLGYVYNNLGYAFFLQGKVDAAIDAYKKAAELNPVSSRIRNNLNIACLTRDGGRGAEIEAKTGGPDARISCSMARTYYNMDLFSQAMDYYSRALHQDPTMEEALKGLKASETLLKLHRSLAEEAGTAGTSTFSIRPETASLDTETGHVTGSSMDCPRGQEAAGATQSFRKVAIEVSNGNGVNNMARDMKAYLETQGFKVVRVTNARRFNYSRGCIMYSRGCYEVAKMLAANFPPTPELKEADMSLRGKARVRLIMGRDLVPYRDVYKEYRVAGR